GEMQRRAFLHRTRQRARERHFKSVEDPGDAERKHDAGVKAAPAETIEPRRNAGFDDAGIILHDGCGSAFLLRRTARDPLQIHATNEKAPRERECPRILTSFDVSPLPATKR